MKKLNLLVVFILQKKTLSFYTGQLYSRKKSNVRKIESLYEFYVSTISMSIFFTMSTVVYSTFVGDGVSVPSAVEESGISDGFVGVGVSVGCSSGVGVAEGVASSGVGVAVGF